MLIAAAIGGTAEKLGGGKFANGAVTGAYVMMFNHLGEHGEIKRIAHYKEIATTLRNEKFINGIPNPFYGAEAIFGDIGFTLGLMERDEGLVFILSGDNAGDIYRYEDFSGGPVSDVSILNVELGRLDLFGLPSNAFLPDMITGDFRKFSLGGSFTAFGVPLGAGGAYSISYPYIGYDKIYIRGFAITGSVGYSVLGVVSAGFHLGNIRLK